MSGGGHPAQSFYVGIPGNATIGASMGGTAAATLLGTVSAVSGKFMEIWNLTSRNIDIIIGNDYGAAAYITSTPGSTPITTTYLKTSQFFCPGTASATVAGRGNYFPVTLQQSTQIWVRTTENTPITASSTSPLVINIWS